MTDRDPGRPTKLTPERADLIIAQLESGGTVRDAAAIAGVHVDTVMSWRSRGEREAAELQHQEPIDPEAHTKPELVQLATDAGLPTSGTKADIAQRLNDHQGTIEDRRYIEFSERYVRARAQLKINLIGRAVTTGSDDWRMYAWMLERMFPEQFAPTARKDLPSDDGAGVDREAVIKRGEEIALKIEQAGGNVRRLPPPAERSTG